MLIKDYILQNPNSSILELIKPSVGENFDLLSKLVAEKNKDPDGNDVEEGVKMLPTLESSIGELLAGYNRLRTLSLPMSLDNSESRPIKEILDEVKEYAFENPPKQQPKIFTSIFKGSDCDFKNRIYHNNLNNDGVAVPLVVDSEFQPQKTNLIFEGDKILPPYRISNQMKHTYTGERFLFLDPEYEDRLLRAGYPPMDPSN